MRGGTVLTSPLEKGLACGLSRDRCLSPQQKRQILQTPAHSGGSYPPGRVQGQGQGGQET